MSLATTNPDRTITRAVYKLTGENLYRLRQIDEFALAYYNEYISKDIYNKIGDIPKLTICSTHYRVIIQ